eukprot:scaffold67160_cov28-Tisochrysis_lutea.AAC.12
MPRVTAASKAAEPRDRTSSRRAPSDISRSRMLLRRISGWLEESARTRLDGCVALAMTTGTTDACSTSSTQARLPERAAKAAASSSKSLRRLGSAPLAQSSATVSACPFIAAPMSAVRRPALIWLTSAPALSRRRQVSVCPPRAEARSAECDSSSLGLADAPAASSTSRTAVWPSLAAMMRGVHPSAVGSSRLVGRWGRVARRRSTLARSPLSAACSSGCSRPSGNSGLRLIEEARSPLPLPPPSLLLAPSRLTLSARSTPSSGFLSLSLLLSFPLAFRCPPPLPPGVFHPLRSPPRSPLSYLIFLFFSLPLSLLPPPRPLKNRTLSPGVAVPSVRSIYTRVGLPRHSLSLTVRARNTPPDSRGVSVNDRVLNTKESPLEGPSRGNVARTRGASLGLTKHKAIHANDVSLAREPGRR